MVFGKEVSLETQGFSDVVDITKIVQSVIEETNLQEGIACVSAIGSTASISTIEYESALATDLKEALERFLPHTMHTRHSATWGDDNGFSHLRATLMGPSLCLPFKNRKLILGTWQQIILIDHDNRPRKRRIYIQIVGE